MPFYFLAVKPWVDDMKKVACIEIAGNRKNGKVMDLSDVKSVNDLMHKKAMPIRNISFKYAKDISGDDHNVLRGSIVTREELLTGKTTETFGETLKRLKKEKKDMKAAVATYKRTYKVPTAATATPSKTPSNTTPSNTTPRRSSSTSSGTYRANTSQKQKQKQKQRPSIGSSSKRFFSPSDTTSSSSVASSSDQRQRQQEDMGHKFIPNETLGQTLKRIQKEKEEKKRAKNLYNRTRRRRISLPAAPAGRSTTAANHQQQKQPKRSQSAENNSLMSDSLSSASLSLTSSDLNDYEQSEIVHIPDTLQLDTAKQQQQEGGTSTVVSDTTTSSLPTDLFLQEDQISILVDTEDTEDDESRFEEEDTIDTTQGNDHQTIQEEEEEEEFKEEPEREAVADTTINNQPSTSYDVDVDVDDYESKVLGRNSNSSSNSNSNSNSSNQKEMEVGKILQQQPCSAVTDATMDLTDNSYTGTMETDTTIQQTIQIQQIDETSPLSQPQLQLQSQSQYPQPQYNQMYKSCMKVKTQQESLSLTYYNNTTNNRRPSTTTATNVVAAAPIMSDSFSSVASQYPKEVDVDEFGYSLQYQQQLLLQQQQQQQEPTEESSTNHTILQWGDVNIREYEICLGDNPACAEGVPIQLDWMYDETSVIVCPIEIYELGKVLERRGENEGGSQQYHPKRLSPRRRQQMLLELGYTPQQMKFAIQLKARDQKRRIKTVSRLKYMEFDSRVEKIVRIFPSPQ